jgi:bacterioferritin-associated ferredoxin
MENKNNSTAHSIARQSQIKTMLEVGQQCGKCIDLKTLVAGAELLTDWVVNGYSKEIGDRLVKLQEHIDSL